MPVDVEVDVLELVLELEDELLDVERTDADGVAVLTARLSIGVGTK